VTHVTRPTTCSVWPSGPLTRATGTA
jgi:hypothetical protein